MTYWQFEVEAVNRGYTYEDQFPIWKRVLNSYDVCFVELFKKPDGDKCYRIWLSWDDLNKEVPVIEIPVTRMDL